MRRFFKLQGDENSNIVFMGVAAVRLLRLMALPEV